VLRWVNTSGISWLVSTVTATWSESAASTINSGNNPPPNTL